MPSIDLLSALRAGLPERYHLERELASGAMGQVFLAQDLQHGHPVAIKVLKPDLSAVLGKQRFLNEIQVTRRLVHPYILPIYDSGAADGLLYYVMPYISDESLRARLEDRGPLAVGEAIKTAQELADALDFMHRHNVVHRDLKPDNIYLQAGHAVIGDFGIARAIHRAGADRLTTTGFFLGTVPYASPEQIAGEANLDGRSDLYSLGCILHEMLTGKPPYESDRAEAVMGMHVVAPIPDAGHVRAETPPGVRQALRRVLAKNREDRFSTGAEFSEAIGVRARRKPHRWIATSIIAAAIVMAMVFIRPPTPHTPDPVDVYAAPPSQSLAVMPFASLSGGTAGNRFAAGLCEELRDRMAKVPGLHVAAGSASDRFADQGGDIDRIGKSLRVSMLLEGSVRIHGNRCRTAARLVNVADGYVLWSDTYEPDLDDSIGAQKEVADAVAAFLEATILGPDVTGATPQVSLDR